VGLFGDSGAGDDAGGVLVDLGDMSGLGNAGCIVTLGDVGVDGVERGTWFRDECSPTDEVGREPFSCPANRAACFLCHRRLLGNCLAGSDVQGT
jgi:hypothetical protein